MGEESSTHCEDENCEQSFTLENMKKETTLVIKTQMERELKNGS